jgi:anti-anti-sigma regulatory factor
VILDLSGATATDPTALRGLRRAAARCRANGVGFLLRNPPPTVLYALRADRLPVTTTTLVAQAG